ncbi:MAG: hypothetical protein CR997_14360 [Acidobacteria bacterium]|nr:MAG: hypothetical protein CR997_14360 [Acidobacteriota bacterium]
MFLSVCFSRYAAGLRFCLRYRRADQYCCRSYERHRKEEHCHVLGKCDYLERKRKVVLSGNAKVWQDKNMVTGDKIVYYLDEGRSEVVTGDNSTGSKGGKKQGGRVQMTILQN